MVALYREDGQPVALPLDYDLANDLDALITQLRRMPGDGGAVGAGLDRVRGVRDRAGARQARPGVLLRRRRRRRLAAGPRRASTSSASRCPRTTTTSSPVGDLDILADAGLHDFELEAMAEDYDEDSADAASSGSPTGIKFGPEFAKALASFE